MIKPLRSLSWLLLVTALSATAGPGLELIQDAHFERGFILWKTAPGRHVEYGTISSFSNAAPVWGLSQWSSRFPLGTNVVIKGGTLEYGNIAKIVVLGPPGVSDLTLAVNSGAEYAHTRKSPNEPWVHLLVEQEFQKPESLAKLSAAKLHIEARLLHSRLLNSKDYNPALHAAQFTLYFTVQNRNVKSSGYGDLLWFGIPLYDNRNRFPEAFKEQDFGGTAKFIFTPAAREFMGASLHDGNWVSVDKDLLPLMRDALATAWSRGFLKGSKKIDDYYIAGAYMGWELPGTFDVSLQVRNFSLLAVPLN